MISEKTKIKTADKVRLPLSNKYTAVMLVLYGIAILACFIINLAVSHTLSWFYIVLVSVLISFSITNLPLLLKKHKSVISAVAATLLTYLLLYVCCPPRALLFAYIVATVAFAFAWLIFIVIKYFKVNWAYKAAIILIVAGIATITSNPFINLLIEGEFNIADNHTTNGIVSICLMVSAVICLIVGIIKTLQTRHSK